MFAYELPTGGFSLGGDWGTVTFAPAISGQLRQHEVGDQVNLEIEGGSGERRTVTVSRVA